MIEVHRVSRFLGPELFFFVKNVCDFFDQTCLMLWKGAASCWAAWLTGSVMFCVVSMAEFCTFSGTTSVASATGCVVSAANWPMS